MANSCVFFYLVVVVVVVVVVIVIVFVDVLVVYMHLLLLLTSSSFILFMNVKKGKKSNWKSKRGKGGKEIGRDLEGKKIGN